MSALLSDSHTQAVKMQHNKQENYRQPFLYNIAQCTRHCLDHGMDQKPSLGQDNLSFGKIILNFRKKVLSFVDSLD